MTATARIFARLAAWTCFFCGASSTGSDNCTNCGV